MENKYLLELSIRHGLNDNQLAKIADVLYQMGIEEIGDDKSQKFVNHILENDMIELPIEQILDGFRKKKEEVKPADETNGDSAATPPAA